jgi:hypothetical protein
MFGTAQADDHFGHSLAAGDFDNDGYTDLAASAPEEDFLTADDDGGVHVLYASAFGLSADGNAFFSQDNLVGTPQVNDHFGFSLVAADLGNGPEDDLAIGVPFEDEVGGIGDAGAVNVVYGAVDGLSTTGNQFWHQDSNLITGVAEPGDQFGYALAAADFGNGSHADLAVGVPNQADPNGTLGAGAAHVFYGTAGGLSGVNSEYWSQNTLGVIGVAGGGDQFGFSLAAADFGDGAEADLAVGVAADNEIGNLINSGAVNVFYGGTTGLGATGDLWGQNVVGLTAEAEDHFGHSLAAAHG